jgi:hypothetical protein
MKRRGFLSVLGAAAVMPVLPMHGAQAAAVATRAGAGGGYARLLYGLAVYHAETGGAVSATALMPKLGVTAGRADALVARMAARGVIEPVAGSAPGLFRATPRQLDPRAALGRFSRWLDRKAEANAKPEIETDRCPNVAQETDNGKV